MWSNPVKLNPMTQHLPDIDRHKIVAHKIIDLVVLIKGMKPLKYEQEQEARSWCGGKKPMIKGGERIPFRLD